MLGRWLFVGLLWIGWMASPLSGATVSAPILYHGFERLSFPVGADQLIYPGCRFSIVRGDSAIGSGEIEVSRPGISISAPVAGLDSLMIDPTVTAVIDCFEIDSTAQVRIGHLAPHRSDWMVILPESPPGSVRVATVAYRNQLEMLYDYQAGRLDGIITDYAPRLESVLSLTSVALAPWVISLVPNPASREMQDGILTTSLFYRFNPANLPLMTDSDSSRAWFVLFGDLADTARPYPYDAEKGRQLLRAMRSRPDRLKIRIEDKTLERPAAFFADILSRDRLKTEIGLLAPDADLSLLAIPLETTSDTVSLRYLINLLASDTTAGRPINEAIAQAGFHLEAASRQPNDLLRGASLRSAARKLTEDVGVFPLFRPGLFFTHRPTLTSVSRTESGRIDLSRLIVLTPPAYLVDQR